MAALFALNDSVLNFLKSPKSEVNCLTLTFVAFNESIVANFKSATSTSNLFVFKFSIDALAAVNDLLIFTLSAVKLLILALCAVNSPVIVTLAASKSLILASSASNSLMLALSATRVPSSVICLLASSIFCVLSFTSSVRAAGEDVLPVATA